MANIGSYEKEIINETTGRYSELAGARKQEIDSYAKVWISIKLYNIWHTQFIT